MSIWKIVSGILSIVLSFFVIFQSCAAGLVNALSQNGQVSGSAGLIVAVFLLAGGIVSIATRNAISNAGNVSIIVIYGIAAIVGYLLAGNYADLVIWATWCLLCAVIAVMAIAADNVCDTWVYVVIAILGIVIAIFGFISNFSDKENDSNRQNDNKQTAQSNEDSSNAELPTIAVKDENESGDNIETAGSGTLGDYYVEIKSAELKEDYNGESVIVITYAWTNNSEDTTSAMVSTFEKAFQDGIELDSAYTVKDVDFSNNSKDVRPGTTIDIKKAFVLTSDSSIVEFEVTEWISFSDDMVSMNFDPQNLERR